MRRRGRPGGPHGDAADPDRFGEAAELLRAAAEAPTLAGKPLLVLANKQDAAGLRRKGRLRYPSELVSDLVWMPKYAQHLAHPAVVAVAKAMLDDHLRIAQLCAQPLSSGFRQKR